LRFLKIVLYRNHLASRALPAEELKRGRTTFAYRVLLRISLACAFNLLTIPTVSLWAVQKRSDHTEQPGSRRQVRQQ
jgi:hypothetical protein